MCSHEQQKTLGGWCLLPWSSHSHNQYRLHGLQVIPHVLIRSLPAVFFRISNFAKDTEQLVEPVAGTDKYRRDFSFYIYEKTLEAHKHHINVLGGIGIAGNLLSALSAVLGLVGVYKKIPVLVRIWAYGLALYLGWWTFWVSRIDLLEKNFTIIIRPSLNLACLPLTSPYPTGRSPSPPSAPFSSSSPAPSLSTPSPSLPP